MLYSLPVIGVPANIAVTMPKAGKARTNSTFFVIIKPTVNKNIKKTKMANNQ